jgi:hypothetical protein
VGKRKQKRHADGELSPQEQAAEQNGSIGTSGGLLAAIAADDIKLRKLALVCSSFKRHLPVTPDKIGKFIARVFEIAGVELT